MLKDIKIDNSIYEPIYIQIARKLRDQILQGKLSDGTKLPPEPKMAEIFGANRLTLRKSLKQLEAQRLVVQKKGRGTFVTYSPRKTYRIGLNFSAKGTDRDSFGLRVLNGLVYALQNSFNSELVLLNTHDPQESSIMQAYNELNCDGLIIVGTNNKDVEEVCSPEFDKVPVVVMCGDKEISENANRVWINTSSGEITTAVERLFELGHRKTLFISTDPYTPDLKKRNAEYREAVEKLGIAETSELIEITNVDSWYDASRDIMREKCMSNDCPTAVVCSGRVFAYGAWQGIMEAGLRIPDDISIIGIGCEEDANPHLSTINVDVFKMAELAGETVINLLEHRNVPEKQIYFDTRLIERGSCKSLQN
jgi:LacI family transcriptional regulator